MALADVISQLGSTIINLVSNTVQGIADFLNDNIGDIPDTGGESVSMMEFVKNTPVDTLETTSKTIKNCTIPSILNSTITQIKSILQLLIIKRTRQRNHAQAIDIPMFFTYSGTYMQEKITKLNIRFFFFSGFFPDNFSILLYIA